MLIPFEGGYQNAVENDFPRVQLSSCKTLSDVHSRLGCADARHDVWNQRARRIRVSLGDTECLQQNDNDENCFDEMQIAGPQAFVDLLDSSDYETIDTMVRESTMAAKLGHR